jgi:tetratricopeptide (TPR) repeat protein
MELDPLQTLRDVRLRTLVVQDFRPLHESLEWKLSELHWQTFGLSSFVSGEVPYTINNSGVLSSNAALTLLANCEETAAGLPIEVLELGAGSGLFARSLLDEFRRLCEETQKPYFDRLTYYVSDASARTVEQWSASGQFREFERHVVTGVCDALRPGKIHVEGGETRSLTNVRAVFANYLLDSLPASIVRKGETGPEELYIRTQIRADNVQLQEHLRLNPEEIRGLVESDDPTARIRLIRLAHLFDFDTEFRAASPPPPFLDEALAFGYNLDRVLLNHGAVRSLEGCREILALGGFVLFNDYGVLKHEEAATHAVSQRFGPSTAIGLNFPLIGHHFGLKGCTVLAPEDDEVLPVHPRLLFQGALPKTQHTFLELFSGASHMAMEDPIKKARQHTAAGRVDRAKEAYEYALSRFPRDWQILGEVAEFVIRDTSDFAAGEQLARAALSINPWHSTWLLNILGDALFCLDRFAEAHQAYLKALALDPGDVRTNLNLAYTYLRLGEYQEALQAIAVALARDRAGQHRDRLLMKQQEILQAASAQWESEKEWTVRRQARLQG